MSRQRDVAYRDSRKRSSSLPLPPGRRKKRKISSALPPVFEQQPNKRRGSAGRRSAPADRPPKLSPAALRKSRSRSASRGSKRARSSSKPRNPKKPKKPKAAKRGRPKRPKKNAPPSSGSESEDYEPSEGDGGSSSGASSDSGRAGGGPAYSDDDGYSDEYGQPRSGSEREAEQAPDATYEDVDGHWRLVTSDLRVIIPRDCFLWDRLRRKKRRENELLEEENAEDEKQETPGGPKSSEDSSQTETKGGWPIGWTAAHARNNELNVKKATQREEEKKELEMEARKIRRSFEERREKNGGMAFTSKKFVSPAFWDEEKQQEWLKDGYKKRKDERRKAYQKAEAKPKKGSDKPPACPKAGPSSASLPPLRPRRSLPPPPAKPTTRGGPAVTKGGPATTRGGPSRKLRTLPPPPVLNLRTMPGTKPVKKGKRQKRRRSKRSKAKSKTTKIVPKPDSDAERTCSIIEAFSNMDLGKNVGEETGLVEPKKGDTILVAGPSPGGEVSCLLWEAKVEKIEDDGDERQVHPIYAFDCTCDASTGMCWCFKPIPAKNQTLWNLKAPEYDEQIWEAEQREVINFTFLRVDPEFTDVAAVLWEKKDYFAGWLRAVQKLVTRNQQTSASMLQRLTAQHKDLEKSIPAAKKGEAKKKARQLARQAKSWSDEQSKTLSFWLRFKV